MGTVVVDIGGGRGRGFACHIGLYFLCVDLSIMVCLCKQQDLFV